MLTTMSGPEVTYAAGDEHDFSDEEAKRLVEAGFAEAVKAEKKVPLVTMKKVEKATAPKGDVETR